MTDKVKIREKIIKGTEIILWKNKNKNPKNNNYNITIAKKGLVFLAISSQHKKDLSVISSKFDNIVTWIENLINEEE